MHYPTTPDGRYFVVRGRLWRCSNPALDPAVRETLVHRLMSARRALQTASKDDHPVIRAEIDKTKRDLGERGPVWWNDGAPDLNRHMARTTPYAEWFAGLENEESAEP